MIAYVSAAALFTVAYLIVGAVVAAVADRVTEESDVRGVLKKTAWSERL